jgi:pilus assembly protein CpaE
VTGGSRALASLRRKLAAEGSVELVELDGSEEKVDAVLLELGDEPEAAAAISAVREAASAPVIALAPAASPALLDQALEAGAADVFVQPYDAGSVLFAVEKALHASRPAAGGSRVVTVFSPKGGTGKSAIASNLGALLARKSRAILLDFDLEFGDASLMLGLDPQSTVRELLATPAALDEHTLRVHADRHAGGLHLLAAPHRPEDAELVDEHALRAVLRAAVAGYDAVVVDTAPSFDTATLAALDVTDDLLVVCTPDIATVKNVRLALETLAQLDVPHVRAHVVLNRSGEPAALTRAEVESALERPVDLVLPFDPAVQRGVNVGRPAVLERAGGPFATALLDTARRLAGEPDAAPGRQRPQLLRFAAAFSR